MTSTAHSVEQTQSPYAGQFARSVDDTKISHFIGQVLPSSSERLARLSHLTSEENASATLEAIFSRIAEGEALGDVASAWDVPRGKLLAWLMAEDERWRVYLRGLEVAAHALVGEALDIADNGEDLPRDKLRIDTRFRLARYHAPDIYADKPATSAIQIDHAGGKGAVGRVIYEIVGVDGNATKQVEVATAN